MDNIKDYKYLYYEKVLMAIVLHEIGHILHLNIARYAGCDNAEIHKLMDDFNFGITSEFLANEFMINNFNKCMAINVYGEIQLLHDILNRLEI
jgi:hypothetical protein